MFLLEKFRKKFIFKNNNVNTILYLIFAFLLLTLIYDVLYMSIEKMDSIVTMLYYNVVTASTVGYGDFSPQTMMGKILTAIYIPVAISLFAALLSVLGSSIYSNIHRRDNGLKEVSSEIDYLIIGGFKEKVDELVLELTAQNKKVALINNHYETLPLSYKAEGVLWIKGDVVSDRTLEMVDHSKVKNYIVLSAEPTNLSSDMFSLYILEKLRTYVDEKNITVEVVERLKFFPLIQNIRYMKVIKGALIAKEVVEKGLLKPIENILDNNEQINQYNLICSSEKRWDTLEKELNAIGYLNSQKEWVYFPPSATSIKGGTKIKVMALSTDSELSDEKIEQSILIVGDNKTRINQLKDNYHLDKRYAHNSFKSIASIETDVFDLSFEEEYTHVVILADLEKKNNDTVNYFYWKYFREKFPNAKMIVELINANNRMELEEKYEDSNNQFVSIFQIGLIVQELQDEGIIHLIENLTNEKIEKVKEVEERLE